MRTDYKQYAKSARRGIKSEAFFESLIVDHAIPHRIARQNDLGVDFLCEWVYGERPSGVLFLAQVKGTTWDTVKPMAIGRSALNCLDAWTLKGAPKVDERTMNYWKGLGLPAFLFLVVEEHRGSGQRCYHKRYTPLLDGHAGPDDRDPAKSFYEVSSGSRFLAFADEEKEIGGFARDLVIDFVRLSYSRGHIVPMTPKALGVWPFADKKGIDVARVFPELIGWHRRRIEETWAWTGALLGHLPEGRPEKQRSRQRERAR